MSRWNGKSRGSVLGYKIFLLSIRVFGLRSAYLILWFVTYYYFLFAGEPRRHIMSFYQSALHFDKAYAKKLTRKNFYVFGQTLLDRTAFLIGKDKRFSHSFTNEEVLKEMVEAGEGGILISAHLGNWETAGNLLKHRVTSKINVVMIDAEVQKIKKYLDSSTGGSRFNIIPIREDMSHAVKIYQALKKNEFVAIHGDRFVEGSKTIELDFLGRKAHFPYGPFVIASKYNSPVTFVFAVKESKFHYALSATVPIREKCTPEEIASKYVGELERMVKKHPEQWFNYFDYYQHAG